jgi:hypothetical protein
MRHALAYADMQASEAPPQRLRFFALLLLMGAVLGACAGGSPGSQASPTALLGLNVNSEVGLKGGTAFIGPVVVGMTIEQLSQAAGVPLIRQPDFDQAMATTHCAYMSPGTIPGYVPPPNSGNKSPLAFMIVNNQLARIDILGGDFKTAAGVKVGSSERQVQEAFGGPNPTPLPTRAFIGEPYRYLTATPKQAADANNRLVFETDGAKVVTYRVGRIPEVENKNGCSA